MGLPLSSLVAEILQFFELRVVKHNLETKSIIIYTRYLDDILILYDESRTNVDTLTRALNNIHNNLPSVPSHEREGQVNFLDLWIIRNNTTLEIDIFRKPTTTDTTIHYLSNHPAEQNGDISFTHTPDEHSQPQSSKQYTAFGTDWNLYQCTRVPLGICHRRASSD
jgi:hypothetical protein